MFWLRTEPGKGRIRGCSGTGSLAEAGTAKQTNRNRSRNKVNFLTGVTSFLNRFSLHFSNPGGINLSNKSRYCWHEGIINSTELIMSPTLEKNNLSGNLSLLSP